ncbi:MAG: thio(seleno)oxazole modification radical SAM maturase SbtM, partial [Desulfobacterales bacterium]|nr:thio(seleno)oxazole modification radical SAM maturase SbtM [Desulfobacterales bacterium]
LALKLVVEGIDPEALSAREKTPIGKIQAIIHRAVDQGLLIAPETKIVRTPNRYAAQSGGEPFLKSDVFTLQWHVTQACDLHCRHCYDRSDRTKMSFAEARRILDDFFTFTQAMNVRGHITFTGGNPLLYPDFSRLYKATSDLGFSAAILGNPASAGILSSLQDIQPMTHFQISLEGLETYNDYIRGQGHFKRSLAFLDILREKNIYAMVMLTLNRDNMDQVLPLAEVLRDRADSFTFNRLALVGEGEALRLPDPGDFKAFLKDYAEATASNPVLRLKDNLFNILKKDDDLPLFGGCTGHGCGAAFNFFSLLPDGEVYACRKFPSLIGSVNDQSLLDIYNGRQANLYRKGSEACSGCDLFNVCRGCPAVVYGMGLEPFSARDPFCTYAGAPNLPVKS